MVWKRPWKVPYKNWVIPEKIHTPPPPRRMGSFFNPYSHLDFLKPKTPPPVWISKTKDPPSRLDFWEKILGLNLIYF